MSELDSNQPGGLLPATVAASASLSNLQQWSADGVEEPLLLPVRIDETSLQLRLTERLRVLPGRRLVCGGERVSPESAGTQAEPQQVVVKWFFGSDASRHAERERRGVGAMLRAAVQTPRLLASWRLGPDATALVFERVPEAQPVTDELLTEQAGLWPLLWGLLACLHSAGVTHTDLHFGNLLYSTPAATGSDALWLIDGDGVRQVAADGLSLESAVQAFAGLSAQARACMGADALREHWSTYCEARGWSADQPGFSALERSCRAARRARVLHFQAKTRRTCSAFAERRTILGTALIDREWLGDTGLSPQPERVRELLGWLDALPGVMTASAAAVAPYESAAVVLKSGNTATVIRTVWHGRPLVVKRYNNKSSWHRLRRLVRPDRGLNNWVFAHTLRFLGIPTARAVALLRTRFGGPTYLVMEASEGVELNARHLEANEPLCQRLVGLLSRIGAEGLVHNDTKASNFLWDEKLELLQVIDLDAMQMPASAAAQLSGQERDRRRLLRNFAATPELQRRFRGTLGL